MSNQTDKKQQIVKGAETLFYKFGYIKTSLEDIAKEAGLGKGTIYYYFESKEDIFLEVVKQHATEFYNHWQAEIQKQDSFAERFSTAICLPIKLVYKHAPILLEAIKSLPPNYLQKLDAFREENKFRAISLLSEVVKYGIEHDEVEPDLEIERFVKIVYDWFLLGDSNIIIKYPEEFIKKAEQDYDWLVHLVMYGIIKRG
jgi:AcrR family transcriptional regulator